MQKYSQLLGQLQELKNIVQQRDQEKDGAIEETLTWKKEKQKVEITFEEERNRRQIFEELLEEKEKNISALSDHVVNLQNKLKLAYELVKEKEGNVLEAQQHLAKKVKEVSRQNEVIEEQQRQLSKIQEELFETRAKVHEAQKRLEGHVQYEKRYQEQLAAWEEKYFRAYEKLQEAEAQNKELRKIEEKHAQLQQLLSSLGNAIGTPIGFMQPFGMVQEEPKQSDTPKQKQKSLRPKR